MAQICLGTCVTDVRSHEGTWGGIVSNAAACCCHPQRKGDVSVLLDRGIHMHMCSWTRLEPWTCVRGQICKAQSGCCHVFFALLPFMAGKDCELFDWLLTSLWTNEFQQVKKDDFGVQVFVVSSASGTRMTLSKIVSLTWNTSSVKCQIANHLSATCEGTNRALVTVDFKHFLWPLFKLLNKHSESDFSSESSHFTLSPQPSQHGQLACPTCANPSPIWQSMGSWDDFHLICAIFVGRLVHSSALEMTGCQQSVCHLVSPWGSAIHWFWRTDNPMVGMSASSRNLLFQLTTDWLEVRVCWQTAGLLLVQQFLPLKSMLSFMKAPPLTGNGCGMSSDTKQSADQWIDPDLLFENRTKHVLTQFAHCLETKTVARNTDRINFILLISVCYSCVIF